MSALISRDSTNEQTQSPRPHNRVLPRDLIYTVEYDKLPILSINSVLHVQVTFLYKSSQPFDANISLSDVDKNLPQATWKVKDIMKDKLIGFFSTDDFIHIANGTEWTAKYAWLKSSPEQQTAASNDTTSPWHILTLDFFTPSNWCTLFQLISRLVSLLVISMGGSMMTLFEIEWLFDQAERTTAPDTMLFYRDTQDRKKQNTMLLTIHTRLCLACSIYKQSQHFPFSLFNKIHSYWPFTVDRSSLAPLGEKNDATRASCGDSPLASSWPDETSAAASVARVYSFRASRSLQQKRLHSQLEEPAANQK